MTFEQSQPTRASEQLTGEQDRQRAILKDVTDAQIKLYGALCTTRESRGLSVEAFLRSILSSSTGAITRTSTNEKSYGSIPHGPKCPSKRRN